jgi:hypothetical protein
LCFRIVVHGAILPNLFPGWVTSSATAITYTFGLNEDLYRYIALGLLVTIGLMVSLSPVVYQSIERIEMVLVSVILVFLLFAIFIATEPSVWAGVITKPPKGTVGKGRQIRGKRKQKEPGLPSSQHNCMSKSSARAKHVRRADRQFHVSDSKLPRSRSEGSQR